MFEVHPLYTLLNVRVGSVIRGQNVNPSEIQNLKREFSFLEKISEGVSVSCCHQGGIRCLRPQLHLLVH